MNRSTHFKKLALLAALPAAVLMANSAMAGVDVYGKINVSMQSNSATQEDGVPGNPAPPANKKMFDGTIINNYTLDSNASRFGIKASTDLGDTGLKAVGKIEYEVSVDDGSAATTQGTGSTGTELKQRNIYGGIQGAFGTVVAGKFDTPLKESQGKADLFNDYILGDIVNVLLVGENRASNIVMYSTPKMDSGIGANVALMSGEEAGQNNASNVTTKNNSIADYVSASINYEDERMYLAYAHDTGSAPTSIVPVDAGTNPTTVATPVADVAKTNLSGAEIDRLTGQFKVDNFLFGAILQRAKSAENNDVSGITAIGNFKGSLINNFATAGNWSQMYDKINGYIVNAQYTFDTKHVFKIQHGVSHANAVNQTVTGTDGVEATWKNTNSDGGGDLTIKLTTIGYDYKLDSKSKVYAYYSKYKADQTTTADVKRTLDADTLGVGVEYSF